jgi:ADP-heptose:LPS heptosyltransferase
LSPFIKKIYGKKIFLISLNRKNFMFNLFYRYFFLKKVYKNNFQIIINPLISRNLVISDLIIKNFNHSIKIAFEDNQDQLPKFFSNLSNSYYDKLIPKGKFDDVTNNEIFFEKISGKLVKEFDYPKIKKSKNKYAVISMGTSDKKRDIQTDKIIKITNFLLEKTNLVLYFTGKTNDINKYLKIESQIDISKKERIKNKIDNFSVYEFINCIRGSELVITAETATMHIANILKKKTLSIVGGGYFSRFVNIQNKLYFNKHEKKYTLHISSSGFSRFLFL